jgi:hypothetical protein
VREEGVSFRDIFTEVAEKVLDHDGVDRRGISGLDRKIDSKTLNVVNTFYGIR